MPQSREERLRKKREAERRRYNRLKQDEEGANWLKEKEKKQYALKKKKGTVKPIDKCTPRQQRIKRKNWRKISKRYRENKKIKELQGDYVQNNTPPESENESFDDEALQDIAKQRRSNKIRKRRSRESAKKDKLISKLKSKVEKYKKRYQRLKQKNEKTKDKLTPNKRVELIMKNKLGSNEIRKKLLFAEVIKEQINENSKRVKSFREKNILKRVMTGSILEKYRLTNQLPRSMRTKNKKLTKPRFGTISIKSEKMKKTMINQTKILVQEFLEDDKHSRLTAGKNEFVTRKKVKKQKRYLCDTMKSLHKEFLRANPNVKIGYSTFCRFKPFWVKPMALSNRDTCKCMVCGNMEFLIDCFNRVGVLPHKSFSYCKSLYCCDPHNEQCLLRKCSKCPKPDLKKNLPTDCSLVKYYKWVKVKERITTKKTGKEMIVNKVKKTKVCSTPQDALNEFESSIETFLKHEGRKFHQYSEIGTMKKNLKENEAAIHMDFSENYSLKYAEEIQAFHFGGSRKQISLHTVVVYVKKQNCKQTSSICFCSISESLNHEVAGIWAHLKPVLQFLKDNFKIDILHFISDSPSGQYRNKTMFYFLACQLPKMYPTLTSFTWNYWEAGHGKGAPDGVGAVCKRTADRMVKEGKDVASLCDLESYLKNNVNGVTIYVVDEGDVNEISKSFESEKIQKLKGTMKVHQVVSKESLDILEFRELSFFDKGSTVGDKDHSIIGTINYSSSCKPGPSKVRLRVSDVYSDEDNISDSESIVHQSAENFSFSVQDIKSQVYIMVELKDESKRKQRTGTTFRYVAVTLEDMDEDGDVNVSFLRVVGNKDNQMFRLDDQDRASVNFDQIKSVLQTPKIVFRGKRMYYKFQSQLDIFEK